MVPTRWQENCTKSQLKVLLSSLSCFLERSSQTSCIYVDSRGTASSLKSFMMDLVVIGMHLQTLHIIIFYIYILSC